MPSKPLIVPLDENAIERLGRIMGVGPSWLHPAVYEASGGGLSGEARLWVAMLGETLWNLRTARGRRTHAERALYAGARRWIDGEPSRIPFEWAALALKVSPERLRRAINQWIDAGCPAEVSGGVRRIRVFTNGDAQRKGSKRQRRIK